MAWCKLIILLFIFNSAIAQTTIEKVVVSTGATVGYGLIDALLYPIAERNNCVNEYRMLQGATITIVSYELYKHYGTKTMASFLINVYCGIPDLVYYGFHQSEFKNDLPHLKFLPTAGKKVKRSHLYSSSVIGLSFSITLNF